MEKIYDGVIGSFNWDDCEHCKHYRPKEGGCIPLDEDMVEFRCHYDNVICSKFEEQEDSDHGEGR